MFNYTYLWYDRSGGSSPEQVADDFLDVVLNGLRQRGNS